VRESGPTVSHRGILLVLRAAAVLIIATGVNDVIAGALKSYEPLYVYLGAVALVVWLDGVLLGSLIAVTAIALHALLFLPRPAPLPDLLVPAASFAGVVIVFGALRAIVHSRRRREAYDPFPVPATPLLAPPPPPPPDMSEVLSAIDDLRSELRDELRRERETPHEQTLQLVAEARAQVNQERALRDQLQSALTAANEETASAIGRITDLELAAGEVERALAAVRREADEARHKYDLERGRADGEATLRAHLEVELTAERQRAVTAIAERATLASRIAELEQALAAERERVEASQRDGDAQTQGYESRITAERERADAAQRELETQTRKQAARITELEQALAAERERSDAVAAQFDTKLQTIVTHLAADHETDMGKAVEEREEARAEARSLGMRVSTLQRKFDEERHDAARVLSESRAAAEAEIARLRARIEELEQAPAQPPLVDERPRILIAHPDADLRASARTSLERAGYEIVSAADGLEALRTAIAQRPDIVIADAVMPKMDGRELCQLLKSGEKTSHIRVILLARAGDDRPKGDLPPDEVLHKPVPLETLKATLANLLAARQ
jgi:CheY-like chemotaxis protein